MKSKDLKNVTHGEAQKTALLVAGVLIIAAIVFWFRGRDTLATGVISVGVLLVVVGLFIPGLAKVFHRGWMTFAFALGYVNSRILLTVIYFVVFVPYGIVSRILGRDPLDVRSKGRESYWHRRSTKRQTKEQFERLF